ncbi:MAG: Fic/DOC family N-terminal domain-containing protein [Deinococcales bacterium]
MYLLPQHHRDGQRVKIAGVGESVYAYLPPLLPFEPELQVSQEHLMWLEKASRALGQLDGIMSVLQDVQLFIYMYVRKEAVLSSQIEGTQSSLSDLLLFESHEMPGVPLDDVIEVLHYVRALERGQEDLKTLPLSSRLIRNLHQELLQSAEEAEAQINCPANSGAHKIGLAAHAQAMPAMFLRLMNTSPTT